MTHQYMVCIYILPMHLVWRLIVVCTKVVILSTHVSIGGFKYAHLYKQAHNEMLHMYMHRIYTNNVCASSIHLQCVSCAVCISQSLRPEVNRLRTAVDKATSNREQYVHKFCTQLDRDIAELDKEAKEIKNEAQVSTCSV